MNALNPEMSGFVYHKNRSAQSLARLPWLGLPAALVGRFRPGDRLTSLEAITNLTREQNMWGYET